MIDPREEKLPKWAQELLHAERLKTALRFPDQPRPAVDFFIDASGYGHGTPSLREAAQEKVYSIVVPTRRVTQRFVDSRGYLYATPEFNGFGSRGHGEYWLHFDDAKLALRWDLAAMAAHDLLRVDALNPEDAA